MGSFNRKILIVPVFLNERELRAFSPDKMLTTFGQNDLKRQPKKMNLSFETRGGIAELVNSP